MSAVLVLALCLLAGCNKNREFDPATLSEKNSNDQLETIIANQADNTIQTYTELDEDAVWFGIGDEDEYYYHGKRYYIDRIRQSIKSVEDADGNYIGELPIGTGRWIGYSHYICGINNRNGIMRIVDLDRELDNCIVYENDLNSYFSADELNEAMEGIASGSFLCAMNGRVYYTTSPISVDHCILMRMQYDGTCNETIYDGEQYEFTGGGFSKATHIVNEIIYTPVYDYMNEQYSYAEIKDNSLTVIPCESDYYWSLFESNWTLN